ncbi:MAG: hypothetical protein NVS2B12_38070 [Ktedonobacteraceae bacterium]
MAKSRRPIFRESALKQYLQKREQDILPQTVSPPFFTYAWIVLILLVVAGALAWSAEVPTFMAASGVITAQGAQPNGNATQALIFFPAANAPKLQPGETIQLQVGSDVTLHTSKITSVEPGVISPTDARRRFSLDNGAAQVITEPSIVAIASLDQGFPARTFAGTTIRAQVQIGTHSVLSQLSI